MADQPPRSDARAGSAGKAVPPGGSLAIGAMITVVALLFLFLVGVLYYKSWLHRPLPRGMLLVEASPEFAGATVRVEGNGVEVFDGKISGDRNYTLRVCLETGNYSLRVTRGHDVVYSNPSFDLGDGAIARLMLHPPQTRPSARGAR